MSHLQRTSNGRRITPTDSSSRRHIRSPPPSSEHVNLRLTTLSNQLESALELSQSLQAQHTTALSTISSLEAKVNALKSLVHTSQAQAQSNVAEATEERASLTSLFNEWKKGVEGQWGGVQEEWAEERERLARARDEWVLRVHAVEKGLEGTIAKVDAGLTVLEQQRPPPPHKQNGTARVGLVAPPSPRSLSSDSDSPSKSQRKKRSAASRGRSCSKDGSTGSRDVRRPNVPTARTMTMPPLRMPPISEARSASPTTCLHHCRLITSNWLLHVFTLPHHQHDEQSLIRPTYQPLELLNLQFVV
jgi:hypothetical protein